MTAFIQPNRTEVTRSFPVLGFTIRTGFAPSWFEVAIATQAELLFQPEAKVNRTYNNFYSSRAAGSLVAERGEAVYLVPPQVLACFAGQDRLYYALAVYRQPDFRNPEVVRLPIEAVPSVTISRSFTGNMRSLTGVPNRQGGLIHSGGDYVKGNPVALEWGGDIAVAGEIKAVPAPLNGNHSAQPAASPVAQAQRRAALSQSLAAKPSDDYDDGFSVDLWTRLQAIEEDDSYAIEGPIPDAPATSQAQAYSRTLNADYPQASRFVPAASSNFRQSTGQRAINRIVIHITDGGANIAGPISWFQNPNAHVSAHYIIGQDGEIVQMVRHNDIAWHARGANSDGIGIEHVANTRGLMPTEAQYCASAALVRWLCDQYGIPIDRTHIAGHAEVDSGTSHSGCPNAVWNWEYFMGMVNSGSCYPMPQAQAFAQTAYRAVAPFQNGHRHPVQARNSYVEVNPTAHYGNGNGNGNGNGQSKVAYPQSRSTQPSSQSRRPSSYAASMSFSPAPLDAVEAMRNEFVSNAGQSNRRNCITITNAGLRQFYGAALRTVDGSPRSLGSTIQDTMGRLQEYGLAVTPTVFEFNDSNGRLTKGVNRPDRLRASIEQWMRDEAAQSEMSAWYLFGLSLMDGYHSVVLALQFSGASDPLTRIYWADQIYTGWDDITGNLDGRITQLTQRWWDPLPSERKARTRVTLWPLNPPGAALPTSQGRSTSLAYTRMFNEEEYVVAVTPDDAESEGLEEEAPMAAGQALRSRGLTAGECSDDHCPINPASDAGTEHFTLEEFRCRDGTSVPERFRGNVQRLMNELETLRAEVGAPITVNSGYRTCSYNSQLEGSASHSQHLCAQAADIQVAGYTPVQLHATIERLIGEGRMQEGGLGLYNTFVHYDVRQRNGRPVRARWDRRRSRTRAQQLQQDPGQIEPDYSQATSFGEAVRMYADWLSRGLRFSTGVPNTQFFPHSAICKIYAVDTAGEVVGAGSGFYVGRNKVLTAGHVIDYPGGFSAQGVEIVPGLNGNDSSLGGASIARSQITLHPSYNPAAYNPNFDVAIIHNAPDAPFGQWFEMEELRMSPQTGIIACGYAAVGVDPTRQHLDVDTIRELQNGTFTYAAQVRQGSSGGPVFYVLDQTIRVVGINVTTYDAYTNRGLRLTDSLITWINSI